MLCFAPPPPPPPPPPKKRESVQYKATLAITGAIQDTFQEKLLDELGLKTL